MQSNISTARFLVHAHANEDEGKASLERKDLFFIKQSSSSGDNMVMVCSVYFHVDIRA